MDGTYAVCEGLDDEEWKQLYPTEAEGSDVCADIDTDEEYEFGAHGYEVTIEDGEDVASQNFVNTTFARLYGYKFYDVNRDGEWYTYGESQPSEPGLSGWTIYATPIMWDSETETYVKDTISGRTEKSTITQEESEETETNKGAYWFEFLASDGDGGNWRIWEDIQHGWSQTYPGGVNEEEGEDYPYYYDVEIETGDGDYEGYNFGNWRWPVIEVFKWNDTSRDGIHDEDENSVEDYPIAVGRVTDTEGGEEGEGDVIQTEIVALQLTGSNGIASIPLNPDWFGGFEGLDQALERGLMVLEGALDGWVKTYPTAPHNDQINLSFREGLSGDFHIDSFFDVFIDPFEDEVVDQGFMHNTEGETVMLQFGNAQFLVISNEVVPSHGERSVVIDWTTDRPATSRVIYDTVSHSTLGDAPNYGYANSTDTFDTDPKVEQHKVTVSGLEPSTTYYYRSISSASPEVVGGEGTFSTTQIGGAASTGGGGGGGGNGPVSGALGFSNNPVTGTPGTGNTGGQVLGASTEASSDDNQCKEYITTFMGFGRNNDAEQVRRLQGVLLSEGFDVTANGTFDAATLEAVKGFQKKYAADILTPWGTTQPTGLVYITTMKKLNEIYYKQNNCPLTKDEQAVIDGYKGSQGSGGSSVGTSGDGGGSAPDTTQPDNNIGSQGSENGTSGSSDSQVGAAAATDTSGGGFWSRIRNFFGL